jgi:tetratricopeptide (TPR) repeat protein
MSGEANPIQTKEELDSSLEAAYKSGDLGLVALLVWEALHRFPDEAAIARIYKKKLLRDDYIRGLDLSNLKQNVKLERESNKLEEVARIAAIGLQNAPGDRYLLLNLLNACSQHRPDLIEHVLEELGEPESDDIVLLNAHAAYAQEQGDFDRAHGLFKKLVSLQPDNYQLVQNLSASLVGVEDFAGAIELLEGHLAAAPEPAEFLVRLTPLYKAIGEDVCERLLQLDNLHFQECSTVEKARAHVSIRLFLQDFPACRAGLVKTLGMSFDPISAFELAEIELALGDFQKGLNRYSVRFEAFPDLQYCSPKGQRYKGEKLTNKSLFIWGEQGLGDELLFSYFYKFVAERVDNVTLALDPRLMPLIASKFPDWRLVDRHELNESNLPWCDYTCPSGDLFQLFASDVLEAVKILDYPLINASHDRMQSVSNVLGNKTKPRIGISWRGGKNVSGNIRSMSLDVLLNGLPGELDIDVVSLQYTDGHEEEVISHGDRRVAHSGLNNRDDLDGILALIGRCDAVITVDNTVAHLAATVGCPTLVLIPAAQTQYRWKNEDFRTTFFPSAEIFSQSVPGSWNDPVNAAWLRALALSQSNNSNG